MPIVAIRNGADHAQIRWGGSELSLDELLLHATDGLPTESSHSAGGMPSGLRIEYVPSNGSLLLRAPRRVPIARMGTQPTSVTDDPNGVTHHFRLPCHIGLGDVWVTVSISTDEGTEHLRKLRSPRNRDERIDLDLLGKPPAATTLGHWFAALGDLHATTAGSEDFYRQAATMLVTAGRLDGGLVLRREGTAWNTVGSCLPHPELGVSYSESLLRQVCTDGCGRYHAFRTATMPNAAVAVPILDPTDQIWGVVYGIRKATPRNRRRGIRPLEALWVELVAASLRDGIARRETEARALRTRLLFEQVFSPKVIRELEENPTSLEGREQEVSILFCDLRGFTSFASRVAARTVYELLADVMDCLTACVLAEDGVVVDYYGDGLEAIWNAPVAQKRHAELACRAAWTMHEELPKLNHRWRSVVGHPLRLGTGIHTGNALVGNAGSRTRLKYGPRGAAVNLASRIEAATKLTGIPILLSAATQERLPPRCTAYRVCRADLPGTPQPVDLYELASIDDTTLDGNLKPWVEHYEKALTLYEDGKLFEACEILLHLATDPASDHLHADFLLDQIQQIQRGQHGRRKNERQLNSRHVVNLSG